MEVGIDESRGLMRCLNRSGIINQAVITVMNSIWIHNSYHRLPPD